MLASCKFGQGEEKEGAGGRIRTDEAGNRPRANMSLVI